MYRLGHRTHHAHIFLYSLPLIALLAAGAVALKQYVYQNTTTITQAPPVTIAVKDPGSADKVFNEGAFTFKLPPDWKYLGTDPNTAYHPYRWENTASNPGGRMLALYMDNIPTTLAVNRLMPVQAEGNRLTPGVVSDNCTTFTGSNKTPSADTTAKWSGVNFMCDMQNYERDVVGTGSTGGISVVSLKGTMGTHRFFFTYTDNTAQPDYTIFSNALATFMVK